jgi:transcriptional regulator with XRE-family HTH domain
MGSSPHVARNIRRLRLERGLNQRQLAARVNVPQTRISMWECGLPIPDEQLQAIARALGVPARALAIRYVTIPAPGREPEPDAA